MKNYIVLFFLLFSLFCFSQKTSKDMGKITKARLTEVTLLSDLIPDLPTEFKSVAIEFVMKVNGKVVMADCETIALNEEIRTILKTVDAGSKFFVDVNFDAKLTGIKSYTFHTVE